jgi:hypothetical protein
MQALAPVEDTAQADCEAWSLSWHKALQVSIDLIKEGAVLVEIKDEQGSVRHQLDINTREKAFIVPGKLYESGDTIEVLSSTKERLVCYEVKP